MILQEVPYQAPLFLERHSSCFNHCLGSLGILAQILFPTACFPPHGISPSLPYFISMILYSRHFAPSQPIHLNHTFIMKASSRQLRGQWVSESWWPLFPSSVLTPPPSSVAVPGHFLQDSGALMFLLQPCLHWLDNKWSPHSQGSMTNKND